MASAHPVTVVLVPGAFGTSACFDRLLPFFEETGFLVVAGDYPSCNPKDLASVSCENDTKHLRDNILTPLIETESRSVVILAHSNGGIVAAGAAKGLDSVTRAKNSHAGGVIGLVYIAGNICLENESLLEAVGGQWPPFIKKDTPSKGLAVIEPVMETLYNDCDVAMRAKLESTMTPHAYQVFETKATAPCWADDAFEGRRVYIRTLKDCCNPLFIQDIWIQKSGVNWEVKDFDTSHGPFVSQPEAVAQTVIQSTKNFILL